MLFSKDNIIKLNLSCAGLTNWCAAFYFDRFDHEFFKKRDVKGKRKPKLS
jgi:hypothetical protein